MFCQWPTHQQLLHVADFLLLLQLAQQLLLLFVWKFAEPAATPQPHLDVSKLVCTVYDSLIMNSQ
jgi:hypothetical protein